MKQRLIESLQKANKELKNIPEINEATICSLANYLIKDGWIKTPCKVWDKVYIIDYTSKGYMIFECQVEEISMYSYGMYIYFNWGKHIPRFKACKPDKFGKTVFLSREEAEQELARRKGDEDE